MIKLNARDIEFAIAKRLGPRIYTICPNVYWGMGFNHELDLCVLTKASWVWEIEIKTNVFDLKRDLLKRHNHDSKRLRAFFYAVPDTMSEQALELCPAHSGIWVVNQQLQCTLIRKPTLNKDARKFTDAEKFKLIRLATMRLWDRKPRPIYDDGIAAAISRLLDKGFDVSWHCLPGFGGFSIALSHVVENETGQVRRQVERATSLVQMQECMFPEQVFISCLKDMEAELVGVTTP